MFHNYRGLFYAAGWIILCGIIASLASFIWQSDVALAAGSECAPGTRLLPANTKMKITYSGGVDTKACHECEAPSGGGQSGQQDIDYTGNNSQGITCYKKYTPPEHQDNLECPENLYRGGSGWNAAKDGDKCYKCSSYDNCEDSGIFALPKGWEMCDFTQGSGMDANVLQSCKDKNKKRQEDYVRSVQNAAPGGKNYNLSRDSIKPIGSTAEEFCKYYETPEYTVYPYRMFMDACYMGYEYGFGKNMICSADYLGLHAPPPYSEYPNKYARSVHQYLMGLKQSGNEAGYIYGSGTGSGIYEPGKIKPMTDSYLWQLRDKVGGKILAACHDGYMQYMVDYYYCGNDDNCKQALRADKSRIFDPGYKPERTTDSGPDNTPGMILPQLTSSGLRDCGGTQTAYFTCTGGSSAGTSSFWQLALILLNIFTGLIAIVAVGGVVWGALRYAASQDDSSATNEAKAFIRNVILGIVLYLAMWAIMQYIIPGGIFS